MSRSLRSLTGSLVLAFVLGCGNGRPGADSETTAPKPISHKHDEPEHQPGTKSVDLTKIYRGIGKEPAYQTKSPQYCLLILGADAKSRIWLVLDGDRLYLDRNGNGDLTDDGEGLPITRQQEKGPHWFLVPELIDPNGKAKHNFALGVPREPSQHWALIDCELEGKRRYTAIVPRMGATPKDAPIVHVGSLSMGLKLDEHVLYRGREPNELRTVIGTPGLGEGTFAWIQTDVPPKEVHPIADIEFPAKVPAGKPIRVQVSLENRC